MFKSSVVAITLILAGFHVNGQDTPLRKFGVVSKAELEMTSYKLDTSATAVWLFEYGEYRVEGATLHGRIKILKPAGLSSANVFKYINKGENVRNLKASTYDLVDGHMVETKLTKQSIFRESYSESLDVLKFALPQAKVGSVLEFTLDIIEDGIPIGQNWYFQHRIPVAYSEFIFERAVGAEYNKIVQGYHPVALFEDNGRKWRWVMKDIPSFNSEELSPADINFWAMAKTSLADLSTTYRSLFLNTTWERIGRIYLQDMFFDNNVIGTRFLKTEAEQITKGKATELEKVNAVNNYQKLNGTAKRASLKRLPSTISIIEHLLPGKSIYCTYRCFVMRVLKYILS